MNITKNKPAMVILLSIGFIFLSMFLNVLAEERMKSEAKYAASKADAEERTLRTEMVRLELEQKKKQLQQEQPAQVSVKTEILKTEPCNESSSTDRIFDTGSATMLEVGKRYQVATPGCVLIIPQGMISSIQGHNFKVMTRRSGQWFGEGDYDVATPSTHDQLRRFVNSGQPMILVVNDKVEINL